MASCKNDCLCTPAKCCLSEKRCLKEHCGLPHHTLLHGSRQADSSPNNWTNTQSGLSGHLLLHKKVSDVPSLSQVCFLPIAKVNVNQVCAQPRRKVLLQVLPVQIHSQGWLVPAYAVLDPGSDSTLIRKDWADHLQLVGESYQLRLSLKNVVPATSHSAEPQQTWKSPCGIWRCGKVSWVSLNSELLTGPDLLNNMVGILMRCRREKIMSRRTLNKCSTRFMFLKKIETRCASCGEI